MSRSGCPPIPIATAARACSRTMTRSRLRRKIVRSGGNKCRARCRCAADISRDSRGRLPCQLPGVATERTPPPAGRARRRRDPRPRPRQEPPPLPGVSPRALRPISWHATLDGRAAGASSGMRCWPRRTSTTPRRGVRGCADRRTCLLVGSPEPGLAAAGATEAWSQGSRVIGTLWWGRLTPTIIRIL